MGYARKTASESRYLLHSTSAGILMAKAWLVDEASSHNIERYCLEFSDNYMYAGRGIEAGPANADSILR